MLCVEHLPVDVGYGTVRKRLKRLAANQNPDCGAGSVLLEQADFTITHPEFRKV